MTNSVLVSVENAIEIKGAVNIGLTEAVKLYLDRLAEAKPKIIRLPDGAIVVSEIATFSYEEGVTDKDEPCKIVTIILKSGHPITEPDLDGSLIATLYKQYEVAR